jgi:hypothetical protein
LLLRKPPRAIKRAVKKLTRSLTRVLKVVDRKRDDGIAAPVADDLIGQVGNARDLTLDL